MAGSTPDALRGALLALALAVPVAAQEPARPAPQPRRIVDPAKFPPKRSLPARILLAPFTALAPKIEAGLTRVEESALGQRFRMGAAEHEGPHDHLHHRYLVGGLGEGSGFGAGYAVSTADMLSRNAEFAASVHATWRRYTDTRAAFIFDPTGGGKRSFRINLGGRHRLRPQEDFWGVGPDSSPLARSDYDLQERGARLAAEFLPEQRATFAVGVDYSSTSIFPGRDDRYPDTQLQFAPALIPGIRGAELWGPFASAEFDMTDAPRDPRRGASVRLLLAENRALAGGSFDFTHARIDARGYIPIMNRRRVLAIRLLGEFNRAHDGSAVPFFRMARLGDSQTLRGFRSYRFYGDNALSANVEYRYDLVPHLGAFLFGDFGQVYNDLSQLSAGNVRGTFGGGIEIKSKTSTVLRIFAGKSGEGTRVFFRLGRGF